LNCLHTNVRSLSKIFVRCALGREKGRVALHFTSREIVFIGLFLASWHKLVISPMMMELEGKVFTEMLLKMSQEDCP